MLTLAFFATYQLAALLQSVQVEETDFGGLGKMMLGGFVLAVGVAVAITLIRLRLREKHPPAPFISINSSRKPD
jgi:high-affinity Fe2+/Pb2+ permease